MMFAILIICSSFIKTCSAISFDNIIIIKEDPETIRIYQIEEKLDKVYSFLIIILIIISILHIVKAKKERKIMIMIYSYFMACFPIAIKTSRNIVGGLPKENYNPYVDLYLIIAGLLLTILMIIIHLFCIIRSSKLKKEVGQSNKEDIEKRNDFFKDHVL